MKYLITIASIALMISGVEAQKITTMETQKDSAAIAAVLNDYYFRGIYDGDISILKKAFDSRTLLFGDIKGQPYFKTVEQYLDGVAHRQSPKDSGKPFKSEILSIDVINSIAVAKTRVKMFDFNYYNFITFHKAGDRWLIINKTLSHVDEKSE